MRTVRPLLASLRPYWVAIALAGLAIALAPAPSRPASPTDRYIRVEASRFEFAPANIAVNPGDRLTLELIAADVVHGLYLDGYGLDLTAEPGQPARLTFVADRAGAFRFRCSITCGPLHPFMIGRLSVGQNWLFWRAAGMAALLMGAYAHRRSTAVRRQAQPAG